MYAALNGHTEIVELLMSQPSLKTDIKSIFNSKNSI